MSRAIKFRAWNKEDNRYAVGGTMDFNGCLELHAGPVPHAKTCYVLEQFTGMLDKNRKEIYEGDILGYLNIDPDDEAATGWVVDGKVHWWADNGRWILSDAEGFASDSALAYDPQEGWPNLEIIGNIHENPNLLTSNE